MAETAEANIQPTFRVLSQTHSDYAGPLWSRIGLLYRGGWSVIDNAKLFIERAPRERGDYYEWRCKMTSYVNYFARLVGYLTGSLFNQTLVMAPAKDAEDQAETLPDPEFYEAFATNCDTVGTDFSQFVRLALTDALVYRRALVQVDLPVARTMPDGEPPQNLAEQDDLGNRRAYVLPLPLEDLLDWEKDSGGRFTWCVLHRIKRDRATPFSNRKAYRHEFKLWTMADGHAHYTVLQTPLVERDDEIKPDDPLEVTVPTRATSFEQIPILELELPEALWVGNQAGPLCQEHYRRRSDLIGALCRSLVEIPYVKLGPEIPEVHGALPAERAQDPGRGDDILDRARQEGNVVLGSEDEIGFAGPSGRAFELADKQAKDVRDEIFASVNAMALQIENTASAVRRSGDSKAEDRSAIAVILTFLSAHTREFAQQLMTLVSRARGESVRWNASGLESFDAEDRQQIIEDAAIIETLQIPSRRFHVEARTKAAFAVLPNASERVKNEIRLEIERNTPAEEHADAVEQHQKLAQSREMNR